MTTHHGTHNDLHSEQGALPRGAPGTRERTRPSRCRTWPGSSSRSRTWPRSERFAHAFGFTTVSRTADELQLRGTDTGAPCVIVRRGPRSRYLGAAFRAADSTDVLRLADATGRMVKKLPESLGGITVDLTDPSGVAGPGGRRHPRARPRCRPSRRRCSTSGTTCARANATQRPPREPAERPAAGARRAADHDVHRDPELVPAAPGSDRQRLQVLPGAARARPHHELHPLRPRHDPDRPPHAGDDARSRQPVRALGVPGGGPRRAGRRRGVPARAGFHRSWGIGRHIEGSQIFDYWRDPDGLLVEHFTDGDLFDCTLEPGWSPMTASGLAQWGPPVTKDFLGLTPGRESAARAGRRWLGALRDDNEFDLTRLRGLLKVATS